MFFESMAGGRGKWLRACFCDVSVAATSRKDK